MGIIWYFLSYEALRIKRDKASDRPAQCLACVQKTSGGKGCIFFFLTVFYFSVTVKPILLSPDGNIVIFQFVIF